MSFGPKWTTPVAWIEIESPARTLTPVLVHVRDDATPTPTGAAAAGVAGNSANAGTADSATRVSASRRPRLDARRASLTLEYGLRVCITPGNRLVVDGLTRASNRVAGLRNNSTHWSRPVQVGAVRPSG